MRIVDALDFGALTGLPVPPPPTDARTYDEPVTPDAAQAIDLYNSTQ